jgi:hypothetical protein
MNDHKINTNTSPINFRLFDVDDMNIYSEEILQILTRKILRARDYIRSNEAQMKCSNLFISNKAHSIFYDFYVTMYIEAIEKLKPHNVWPRHMMEQLT